MQVHPSVIMGISEHYTRSRASRPHVGLVIGALLGTKLDHNTEVIDSFELRLKKEAAAAVGEQCLYTVDKEFFQKKLPQVEQVSANLELIGWYATAPLLQDTDTEELFKNLHKQISEFISNPIFIKLNPHRRERDPKISGSLPIEVFEPVIAIESARELISFIEVNWSIVTEDVEIIGLEHNAKMSHVHTEPSVAIDNLRLQYSAVKMLKDRIKVISKFVKDTQSGALPYHEEPLADIAKLTKKLPLMNSDQYNQAYNVQCNDVALNTYLGILTKGSICRMHFGMPTVKTRAYSTMHSRR